MYCDTKKHRPIPILYLNYSMEIGGIETLISELTHRIGGNGFIPYIGVFKGGGSLEKGLISDNISLFNLNKKEGIDLTLAGRLRRLLMDKRVKIIHTHNYSSWFYGVLASSGIKGLSHIHTEHSNVGEKRRVWIERILSWYTAKIVCVSEKVRRSMINNQGISSERLTLLYNGVDTKKFYHDFNKRQSCREKLGIKQDSPVIGIVARLNPIKDHFTLLEAFAQVSKDIPDASLLIVGNGELKDKLENKTRNLGLTKNVFFLGERRDIPELLNAMDIFVLSSLNEGHNVSLLEAMATGLPVVVTNVGGNLELVLAGITGFLVPPKETAMLSEKIKMLIKDEYLRSQMGKRGRLRIVEYFDMDRMVNAYCTIYNQLLQ